MRVCPGGRGREGRLPLFSPVPSAEALHLGMLLVQHGYLYPLRDLRSLVLRPDDTPYRFQVRLGPCGQPEGGVVWGGLTTPPSCKRPGCKCCGVKDFPLPGIPTLPTGV